MGTSGPPAAELPAERRLYCICLFAPDSLRCSDPSGRLPPSVCAAHSDTHTHTHTHHPAIKMPARLNKERVCSERFGIPVKAFFFSLFFFPPRRTPETQRGSWRMTGVKYFLWRAGKLSERRELQVTAGIIMMRGFWSQDSQCVVARVFWAALENSRLVILDIDSDDYKMLMQLEVVLTGFLFKSDGNASNQNRWTVQRSHFLPCWLQSLRLFHI